MTHEIPDWLIEMSEQMNSDQTRCTSHPFWQVRQKKFIVTERDYDEHHFEIWNIDECLYRSDISEDFRDLADDLDTYHSEWCLEFLDVKGLMDDDEYGESTFIELFDGHFSIEDDVDDLPDCYTITYMQEIEEVITTHLTQADAEWFIKRKKHDYPNAYTYVESAYWSPQLRQLQDWIKSLSNNNKASN